MNYLPFLFSIITFIVSIKIFTMEKILRIILSAFSSFVFVRLLYPNIVLWNFFDYLKDNNYIELWQYKNKALIIISMILTILIYYITYIKVYSLFINYAKDKSKKEINKLLLRFNKKETYKMQDVIISTFRTLYTYSIRNKHPYKLMNLKDIEEMTYSLLCRYYISFICILLQIIFIMIFVFNSFIIITITFSIVLIVSFLIFLSLPLFLHFKHLFHKSIVDINNNKYHEFNRD